MSRRKYIAGKCTHRTLHTMQTHTLKHTHTQNTRTNKRGTRRFRFWVGWRHIRTGSLDSRTPQPHSANWLANAPETPRRDFLALQRTTSARRWGGTVRTRSECLRCAKRARRSRAHARASLRGLAAGILPKTQKSWSNAYILMKLQNTVLICCVVHCSYNIDLY